VHASPRPGRDFPPSARAFWAVEMDCPGSGQQPTCVVFRIQTITYHLCGRGLSRLYPFMHILVVYVHGAPYMPCLFHMFRFVSFFFFPLAALSCTFAWTYSSNSHSYPPNDPSVGTPPIACKIL
jgi:hypothetical protein